MATCKQCLTRLLTSRVGIIMAGNPVIKMIITVACNKLSGAQGRQRDTKTQSGILCKGKLKAKANCFDAVLSSDVGSSLSESWKIKALPRRCSNWSFKWRLGAQYGNNSQYILSKYQRAAKLAAQIKCAIDIIFSCKLPHYTNFPMCVSSLWRRRSTVVTDYLEKCGELHIQPPSYQPPARLWVSLQCACIWSGAKTGQPPSERQTSDWEDPLVPLVTSRRAVFSLVSRKWSN